MNQQSFPSYYQNSNDDAIGFFVPSMETGNTNHYNGQIHYNLNKSAMNYHVPSMETYKDVILDNSMARSVSTMQNLGTGLNPQSYYNSNNSAMSYPVPSMENYNTNYNQEILMNHQKQRNIFDGFSSSMHSSLTDDYTQNNCCGTNRNNYLVQQNQFDADQTNYVENTNYLCTNQNNHGSDQNIYSANQNSYSANQNIYGANHEFIGFGHELFEFDQNMETFRPQINVSVQNYINNKSEDGQPQQNVPPSQRMILNNAEQIERYNQTQIDRQVLENPLTPPAEMRITRKCSRCGTTETKQWRKSGKEYLCNCCSQYQKRTGRPRPLNLSKKGSLTRIRKPARIQTVGSRIN